MARPPRVSHNNVAMNFIDGFILTLIAVCVVVWPTQLISDGLNRWLRLLTIGAVALQLLTEGPRVPLVPVYLIALMFAGLLVLDRKVKDEPSAIRENKEGSTKTLARWVLIAGTAVGLLVAVVLCLKYSRTG